jgi:hypothetical protein
VKAPKLRIATIKVGKAEERIIEFNDHNGSGGVIRLQPSNAGLIVRFTSLDPGVQIIIGDEK